MLKDKVMLVKKDTVWTSSESVEFVVLEVKKIDEKQWVLYKNLKDKKDYSCLIEAFVNRFFININHKYQTVDRGFSWHTPQR